MNKIKHRIKTLIKPQINKYPMKEIPNCFK